MYKLKVTLLTVVCLSLLGSCLEHEEDAHLDTASSQTDESEPVIASYAQALQTSLCGSTSGLQADSPWPMRGGCPSHSAQSSEYGSELANQNWKTSVGSLMQGSAAIAADGSIYIGTEGGNFYKLNPTTGAIVKSVSLGGNVRSSPAIAANGTIYVGSDNSRLNALDPVTLATKWFYTTGARNGSSPAVGPDGTVYFGSEDRSLYAINPNGTKKWSYATANIIQGSPAIGADGTVYIGSLDAYVYALNPNGTLKWKKQLGWGIQASPALGRSGRLYISASNTLYALDTATGNIVWQKALAGADTAFSPAIGANGVVYVGTFGSFANPCSMYAFSSDGEQLWKFDTGYAFEAVPILDRVGNLFTAGNDGSVYALDGSGRQIWKFLADSKVQSSPVIAKGGALIFGSFNGNVYSVGVGRPRAPVGGACTSDTSCDAGLVCGKLNSARLGQPPGSNACWSPSCENKVKDPGETEIDCGGVCGSCTKVCSLDCTAGTQVAAAAQEVLAFSAGAFLRASSASYQSAADRIEYATANELRFETLGPTGGRLVLFEGERVNRATWSEQLVKWRQSTSNPQLMIKLTEDYRTSPDRSQSADRLLAPANGFTGTDQLVNGGQPASMLSAWVRLTDPASYDPGAPTTTRPKLAGAMLKNRADPTPWALPPDWQRRTAKCEATSDTLTLGMTHEAGTSGTNVSYGSLPAADYVVWGYQLESGSFASSYIRSDASITTRRADRLVYEATAVPAWIRSGLWQLDVSPIMASAELTTSDELVLVAWETGALSLIRDASGAAIKIASGANSAKRTLSWIKGQRFTVTINTTARTVEVRGASSGDGSLTYTSSIAIPVGRLALGALLDGTKSAFARISELRRVASATIACVPDPDCVRCGDGIVSGGETCDPGGSSVCAKDCSAESGLIQCTSSADCGPGQACPSAPNGEAFGAGSTRTFCVPDALCLTTTTPSCGSIGAVCGACACTPSCAGKQCGGDLSDGCGGFCFGVCDAGQVGCVRDTDCDAGYLCGTDNGARYDAAAAQTSRACWPAFCEDIDPRRVDCGSASAPCGLCDPVTVNKCLDGPLCGASAGASCPAGTKGNAVGACVASGALGAAQVSDDDVVTTGVGALPGTFSVSKSGSARYEVPMALPPGRAGLTPDLGFSYDSQAGNGMLGLGWSLQGLSTISLCPKTRAQDVRLDSEPRFCLDGQRLVPVAFEQGRTEWRTEFESFSRVFSAHNFLQPDGDMTVPEFTVQRKNGTTLVYGADEAARMAGRVDLTKDGFQSRASYTNTRAWALSRISDRAGNRIEIRYSALEAVPVTPPSGRSRSVYIRGHAELVPRWIGYNFVSATGDDAANELVFEYDAETKVTCHGTRPDGSACVVPTRPDGLSGYSFGYRLEQSRLLKKISIRAQGQIVRSYKLNHSLSENSITMLGRIDDCAYKTDGSESCRPATKFDYQTATNAAPVRVSVPAWGMTVDWNHDGYDDLVDVRPDSRAVTAGAWNVYLGSTTGFRAPEAITVPTSATVGSGHVVDIDGDGRTDLLAFGGSPSSGLWLLRNDGAPRQIAMPEPPSSYDPRGTIVPLDIDGDHFSDLVYCSKNRSHFDQLYHNDGGTLRTPIAIPGMIGLCDEMVVANFQDGREYLIARNGDDFVGVWQEDSLSQTAPTVQTLDFRLSAQNMLLQTTLDINGDGLRDLLFISRPESANRFAVMLNLGRPDYGWATGSSGESAAMVHTRAIVPVDHDRDGRTDLMVIHPSSRNPRIYNARQLNAEPDELPLLLGGPTIDGYGFLPLLLDVNGDSITDYYFPGDQQMIYGRLPHENLLASVNIHHHASDVPDKIEVEYLSGVADGFFSSGDSSTCGTPGSVVVCPRGLSTPVVKLYRRSAFAQTPGTPLPVQVERTEYLYGPQVTDQRGRGVLGFLYRESYLWGVNGVEYVHVREEYDLSEHSDAPGALNYYYPFTSQPTHVVTSWAVPQNQLTTTDVTLLGRREVTRVPDVRFSDRFRPFTVVPQETTQLYEGAAVDTVIVTRDYDHYGNLKEETTARPEDEISIHLLSYAYETDAMRTAAWQVDLVSSDVRADMAPFVGPGAQIASSTKFEYEPNGLLKFITERATDEPAGGLQTTLLRDARNNVNVTLQGTLLSDARAWFVEYDALAGVYPEQTSNPEGHVEMFAVSYGDGITRRHTDPNGMLTTWKYDGFGRMLEENRLSSGQVTTHEFAASALDTSQVLPTNNVISLTTRTRNERGDIAFASQAFFDTRGHLTAQRARATSLAGPTSTSEEYRYDSLGRLVERSRPHLLGDTTQGTEDFSYDGLGRLIGQVSGDDRQQEVFYATSASVNIPAVPGARRYRMVRAPGGSRVLHAFDARGNLLQTQEDSQVAMTYLYGAGGFMLRATDAVGNAITQTPDIWGRVVHSSDPDEGTHDFTYTKWSELHTNQHNSELHTFAYDGLGRLKSLDNSDGQATWTWDTVNDEAGAETRRGEVMAARSADGHSERYSYQGRAGQLDRVITRVAGVAAPLTTQIEYDDFLRPKILHYPGTQALAVQYLYDDAGSGALRRVQNANNAAQVFWELKSVHQGMRPATVALGDGSTLTATYSQHAGWLDSLRVSTPGVSADLLSIALDHDANANISGVRRLDDPLETLKTTYCYDQRNRLTGVTRGACDQPATLASFSYTPIGNIKTKTGMGTYSYGDPGQLDTAAQRQPHAVRTVTDPALGSHHYEYDLAFGRMQSRSGPNVPTGAQSFTYSAQGMLRTVTDALEGVERFEYGVSGERVLRRSADGSLTAYVDGLYEQELAVDGSSVLSETRRVMVGGKAVAELKRGVGAASTTRYLHRDHLGSVVLVTDGGNGAVLERPKFDVFGAALSAGPELGFTGHRSERELELVDMAGRFYDPALGRFLTPDPTIPGASSAAYNRYAYVYNNPASLVDPSGFNPDVPPGGGGGPVSPDPWDIGPGQTGQSDDGRGGRGGMGGQAPVCEVNCDTVEVSRPRPPPTSDPNALRGRVAGQSGTSAPALRASAENGSPGPVTLTGAVTALSEDDFEAGYADRICPYGDHFCRIQRAQAAFASTVDLAQTAIMLWAGGGVAQVTQMIEAVPGLLSRAAYVGSKLGGAARGVARFFYDPRRFATISRGYWAARGGAKGGASLHHWLFPQRSKWVPQGIRNAGFNLLVLPGMRGVFHPTLGLNQWMGFASRWGGVRALKAGTMEWGIRLGLPTTAGGVGYGTYHLTTEIFDLEE